MRRTEIMTNYYLGVITSEKGEELHQLYAEIDERYYWILEWSTINHPRSAIVHHWRCGLVSEYLRPSSVSAISVDGLREEFGSFAYYLERSVSGFKSYIAWMSPDPHSTEVIWK